jgi:hypothetical protein
MKKVVIAVASLLALLVALIAVLLSAAGAPGANVRLEVAKGLMNLAAAVLVTGALSFFLTKFLADRTREQSLRDERVRVLTNALQDFKAAYGQVSITRFFLSASASATRLEERMVSLAEARARLQRVQRERFLREEEDVKKSIQKMLSYLSDLGNEYRKNYPLIAAEALAEEAERQKILKDCGTPSQARPVFLDSRFPKFLRFLSDEGWDPSSFKEGYREVRGWLDNELDKAVGKEPKSRNSLR